jgi:hypothetical protein
MTLSELSALLKAAAIKRNVTVAALADEARVPYQTLRKMADDRLPNAQSLHGIVRVVQLISDTNDIPCLELTGDDGRHISVIPTELLRELCHRAGITPSQPTGGN